MKHLLRGATRSLLLAAVAITLVWPVAAASPGDIVLYASDVSLIAGLWTRASSTTGAGGLKMTTPDTGWSAAGAPLAVPTHYFEVTFDAQANTSYQLWLRLRAAGNSKWNDSVWVQFDQAIDAAGAPLWRTGTSSGLLVNLEACSGCGVSGWGWQDNAWWTGQRPSLRFAASGPQTIRVQLREDGVDIDQIVLSPVTWVATSPGAALDDQTILSKSGLAPTFTSVREPYLQQVTASSAIVVWASREGGAGAVQYESANGTTTTSTATTRLVPAATTGMADDYYQHEAFLTKLAASTTYTYRVTVGGVSNNTSRQFTTAPPTGSGTARFIAFGDSGVGSTAQRQLAAVIGADIFDFALHTGDVAYGVTSGVGSGSYPQLHSWFFDIYRSWLGSRPIFPSIGNHDDEANRAAPYRDLFVLPRGDGAAAYPDHAERFYSFDYGPAHVVVLDTELAFQDPLRRQDQLSWLVSDLAATAQPWKIAVLHRPPFSAGATHGSDLAVRTSLTPIFETYGVALVLTGHDHGYERSRPWRETAGGSLVTYVVTGGGGAPLYPVGVAPWTAASRSAFHYVRASVSLCTLSFEAVGLDAAVFDSARLDRCGSLSASSPFAGAAAAVPGTVEVERFDEGGEGIAYHDTTPGNAGGAFRATDVDLEATADGGAGHNVGWMSPGEWLLYSVDVASAGLYTIDVRVAANGPGGTFHLELDAANLTGPLTVPATGGWQSWQTVRKSGVWLPAGRHRLRLVIDAFGPTGIFGNVNYLRFSAAGPTPPDIVIYAKDIIRSFGSWNLATDGSAAAGVKLMTPDTGWARVDAPLAAPGDYVEAAFDAPADQVYRLWLRLRATGDTKYSESVWVQWGDSVDAAGNAIHRIGTTDGLLVNLENCSGCGVAGWGWQSRAYWLNEIGEVQFATGGPHTIRIQVREDGVQLDQIVLSPATYRLTSPGALKNDTTIVAKP